MADLYELKARTWLTADRATAVPDGDPAAAFLLGNEGTKITEKQAIELGLIKPATKQVEKPANKSSTGKRRGRPPGSTNKPQA